MTAEEKLLPCPFCGDGEVTPKVSAVGGKINSFVACECGATGKSSNFSSEVSITRALEYAILDWNKRNG